MTNEQIKQLATKINETTLEKLSKIINSFVEEAKPKEKQGWMKWNEIKTFLNQQTRLSIN